MNKAIFLFHTTRDVILSERYLKNEHITVMAIPVPRKLSAECGIALEIPSEESSIAETILNSHAVLYTIHQPHD